MNFVGPNEEVMGQKSVQHIILSIHILTTGGSDNSCLSPFPTRPS